MANKTDEDPGDYNTGRELTPDEKGRLENNFKYHEPFGNQAEKCKLNRDSTRILATIFSRQCPPSRELSLALTKLEEAVFWANAAIARNEKDVPTA